MVYSPAFNIITHNDVTLVKSSQVTFIYIALFTIQIASKQLHSDNMKIIQHSNTTIISPQLSKPKAKATVARNQNSIR